MRYKILLITVWIVFNSISWDMAGAHESGSKTTHQTGAWPAGIAIGDINGDKLSDIVCANYNDNTISMFLQDNGKLLEQATYSTFLNPLGIGIGDIDLDGRNDISVVCAGADIMNIFGQATIINGSISIKYGTITLDGTISLSGIKTFVGEININQGSIGKAWLIDNNLCLFQVSCGTVTLLGSGTLNGHISRLNPFALEGDIPVSDGIHAFDTKVSLSGETGKTLINIANYATKRAPYGLSMGDINDDKRDDIVVANLGAESISIFTWLENIQKSYQYLYHSFAFAKEMTLTMEGDKIFAHIVYPAGKMPFGIDIGDINMDGSQDVVCVNYQSGDMNVFLQGNSVLKPAGTLTTGPNPTSVSCGDINSDGLSEIVASSLGGGMLSVFAPYGSIGTYTTRDARSGGVDIGDINNDGQQDVAVSNDTSNTVSIFIQGRNGLLNPQQSYQTGISPGSCKIADINNDGINEIITGDAQSNTITVHYPDRL
ncbi:VCBS repeat-containing protein [Candidatus Desantisbacteria bacterium]|nr:VCBS repeat-containing protein [Candidatus Desantisbacteria bacterium]